MAVELHPYDGGWVVRFEEAAGELRATGLFEWIEHIGSTSVPGLAAKPIVDVMAGLRRGVEVERLVADVAELGYIHRRGAMIDRETFRRDTDGERTHHLHVVPEAATSHHDILFRDRLRRDSSLRAEYEGLKRRLAQRYGHEADRRNYADGKTEFVQRAVDAERAARGLTTGAPVYSRVFDSFGAHPDGIAQSD